MRRLLLVNLLVLSLLLACDPTVSNQSGSVVSAVYGKDRLLGSFWVTGGDKDAVLIKLTATIPNSISNVRLKLKGKSEFISIDRIDVQVPAKTRVDFDVYGDAIGPVSGIFITLGKFIFEIETIEKIVNKSLNLYFNIETFSWGKQDTILSGQYVNSLQVGLDNDGTTTVVCAIGNTVREIKYTLEQGWLQPKILLTSKYYIDNIKLLKNKTGHMFLIASGSDTNKCTGVPSCKPYRCEAYYMTRNSGGEWSQAQLFEEGDSYSDWFSAYMTDNDDIYIIRSTDNMVPDSIKGKDFNIYRYRPGEGIEVVTSLLQLGLNRHAISKVIADKLGNIIILSLPEENIEWIHEYYFLFFGDSRIRLDIVYTNGEHETKYIEDGGIIFSTPYIEDVWRVVTTVLVSDNLGTLNIFYMNRNGDPQFVRKPLRGEISNPLTLPGFYVDSAVVDKQGKVHIMYVSTETGDKEDYLQIYSGTFNPQINEWEQESYLGKLVGYDTFANLSTGMSLAINDRNEILSVWYGTKPNTNEEMSQIGYAEYFPTTKWKSNMLEISSGEKYINYPFVGRMPVDMNSIGEGVTTWTEGKNADTVKVCFFK